MTALIPSCALLRKDSAGRCSASLVTLVRCTSLVRNSERKHARTRAHKFHVKETGNHFVHLFLARETPKIEPHEALIRPSPPLHETLKASRHSSTGSIPRFMLLLSHFSSFRLFLPRPVSFFDHFFVALLYSVISSFIDFFFILDR